jgi:hypothetical protein
MYLLKAKTQVMLQQYYYSTTVLGHLSQWPTGHVLAVYAKGT